jgi:hypothetical protein
MAENHDRLC